MGKKKAKKQKSKKAKKKAKKIKIVKASLNLRIAKKIDFLEIDKYNDDGSKVWKFRFGLPYWLYNSKGIIENQENILDDNTDIDDFADYLNREQVLVPIKYFDKK